jgi:hypothetical protein
LGGKVVGERQRRQARLERVVQQVDGRVRADFAGQAI